MQVTEFKAGGTARPKRDLMQAMWRGFKCRCPNCGEGRLFSAFVKVAPDCSVCGEKFHHHRADDLPAYLVMVVIGHIIVGAFMAVETVGNLELWQHLAIWIPITIVSCIVFLQPTKGAVVGLQWALYMHGFGGHEDELESHPEIDAVGGATK